VTQRIHPQIPALDHRALVSRAVRCRPGDLAPAQERAYPLGQEPPGKRLGHVVVRPHPQAEHLVDLVIARGQQDHRHPRGLAQPLQQLHAVHARHLDVEHRHVGRRAIERVEGLLTVAVGRHLEPLGLEHHRDRCQDVPVIIDQRNRRHVCNPRMAAGNHRDPPGAWSSNRSNRRINRPSCSYSGRVFFRSA